MPAFDFNPLDLQQLKRLVYTAKPRTSSGTIGMHRIRRSGDGLEFLDYRPYTMGDDFRKIDWALYGRLRNLFVRVTESEECLYATILVDVSRSMCFGDPVEKVQLACQLACGLSFALLNAGDRVQVGTFSDSLHPLIGPLQGVGQIGRVASYLQQAEIGEQTQLEAVVDDYCRRRRKRGTVIIISDLLGPSDYETPIRTLVSRQEKVLVMQTLDNMDLGEAPDGYLRLTDSETGKEVELRSDSAVRQVIRKRAEAFSERVADYCQRYQQGFVLANTQDNYVELICRVLRWGAVHP